MWSSGFLKYLAVTGLFGHLVHAAAIGRASQDASSCPGYKASNVVQKNGHVTGADLNLAGAACNVYGTDLKNLKLSVEYQTNQRLHVKIYDTAEEVYQVPTSVLPRPDSENVNPATADLTFSITNNPFSFTVKRRSSGEVLFDTTGHPIIFESQYLGLRTSLPDSPNIYGLGESVDPSPLPTEGYVRTLWSRDAYGTPQHSNLYGNHPVYFDYRGKNGTHGVFLLNSNGMDIKLNSDSDGQYLEYNTLGGVIDLYFLSGPTPKAVAQQYSQTVGNAVMMPYWGFGFHNCRYGYQDVFEVAEVIYNYTAAKIPLETQWTDIDYMDLRKVFTLDPYRYPLNKVRQIVNYLHSHNQHYVMMVDPAVAYQDYPAFNNGVERNAFLKWSNGSIYQGVVWPGVTAFPDWFGAETQQYWNGEFDTFFDPSTGVDIDALWIDMNEASNFCEFPCTDPAATAASSGDPPIPPPVRLSPPRPIPGFPADFQPTCVATVTFEVDATTYLGENILILGSSVTTGAGHVQNAPIMSPNNYPIWSITLQMPVNGTFNYQYVRKESDGSYIYEAHNRTIKTGDCHSGTKVVTGNITTSSGPHKRAELPQAIRSPVENDLVKRQQPGSMLGLPGRDLLNPPYTINNTAGVLSDRTINTDLIHQGGYAEYDTHNLYGTMMSATSRDALLSRKSSLRPLVITRSTFAGAGRQVGHWLGDNFADWDHYRWTIAELQEFVALYQVPMVGSDICGYDGTTNDNLCSRWIFLGAFSPFFRDHSDNSSPPHELYRTAATAAAARAAIDIRYRLLDYAYTAFYQQTQDGTPMLSPLFFMYPNDENTAQLTYQFFWGPGIMVAPVTDQDSTSVNVYFPKDQFYDFYTGAPITGTGNTVTVTNVAFTKIPLYFKGGNIVPMRIKSAMTTAALRTQNFALTVAPNAQGFANGTLYLDDGESINQSGTSEITFTYSNGKLVTSGTFGYDPGNVAITQVVVLGSHGLSKALTTGSYDAANKVATFNINKGLTGSWEIQLQ